MFKTLLAALGLAPKTLPQATETLATAKTFAESVNAMFTAAGLQLETMLSAGADSLKLHIAGLDNTAEVTRLTSELKTASENLTASTTNLNAANLLIGSHTALFDAIGFKDTAATKPADFKAAHDKFVEKQTTLALAKTGHPPAHVPTAVEPPTATQTDAELYAEYQKMETGPVRLDFFTKHEGALKRALNATAKA